MARKELSSILRALLPIKQAVKDGEPIPKAEFDGLTKREAIAAAMIARKRLLVTYTRKRDGATLPYTLAPYSRRGNKIYATDHKHGAHQIHSFIVSRMTDVEVKPASTYEPVWRTEPETI